MKDIDLVFDKIQDELDSRAVDRCVKISRDLKNRAFPEQRAYLDDPSQWRAVRTARQSGKTHAIKTDAFDAGLNIARANMLYLCPTQKQAESNLWVAKDGLKVESEEFDMNCHFNNQTLTMRIPWTGSTLTLGGCQTIHDAEDYRGQKYHRVYIDETKSFKPKVLEYLIDEVLTPGMQRYGGKVTMAGTPGSRLYGMFYDVTREDSTESVPYQYRDLPEWQDADRQWSLHRWYAENNINCPEIWKGFLEVKRIKGWADDHPKWLREYMGHWIADEAEHVYRYRKERNLWVPLDEHDSTRDNKWGLPPGNEWHYILGIDLGYNDPFAMCVGAYSDSDPALYLVWDYKCPKLTPSQQAERIRYAEELFGGFDVMVCDSGSQGKSIVQEFRQRWGFPIEAAQKNEKKNYIDLFNGDLEEGFIKVNHTLKWIDEARLLTWDDMGREDRKQPNHVLDAALYLWRHSYHHFFQSRRAKASQEKSSKEHAQAVAKKQLDQAIRRREMQKESEGVDLEDWQMGEGWEEEEYEELEEWEDALYSISDR